jgi:hypothetical protein
MLFFHLPQAFFNREIHIIYRVQSTCIYPIQYKYLYGILKDIGQFHEIFDPRFFHQSTPPSALIHGLKPFLTWLRIRRENR